ncbi:hypothetical protein FisN_6Lh463 [Fistulifera solaris]|uniref:Glycogenin glucosyltransferase n=1 Tax=Fistulifera solaris TaxID=1519565 RepID=A0A1Z5JTR8_FISSO|nr:hypothetical protein FisN_6Lh463 [Fistulifera solaris]|eukprot:GAX17161.1 hypothetical protein FisN_6Lh463 [Fistulifera solaris]
MPSETMQQHSSFSIKIWFLTIIAVAVIQFRGNIHYVETVLGNPRDASSTPSINELTISSDHSSPSESAKSSPMFAYTFVIGGCDPTNRASYQNYLFNIAISARILKRLGSQADIVALFQMSQTAKEPQLPKYDLDLLQAQNVTVYYIPQQLTGRESFYRTTLDKFRILGLTQYEKVILMDGDFLPLCNLDFFFLHDTFQEIVVMEGLYEPFNAGFFMVKTGISHLQEVQEIIEKREREALTLTYPYFDLKMGWGHDLSDDPWVSYRQTGTNWTFEFAFSDQGLLYYYAKYHRKSYSLLNRRGGVTHYGRNGDTGQKIGSVDRSLSQYSSVAEPVAMKLKAKTRRHPFPLRCMLHFTGTTKPWLDGGAPKDCCTNETKYKSGKHYWMFELHELMQEVNRDIDLKTYWDPLKANHRPALGLFATSDQALHAQTNLLTSLQPVNA